MYKKADEEIMAAIHAKVAEVILDSLNGEQINPTVLKTAVDFLHKNGITADLGDSRNDYVDKLKGKVIQLTKDDLQKSRDPEIVDDPDELRRRFRDGS